MQSVTVTPAGDRRFAAEDPEAARWEQGRTGVVWASNRFTCILRRADQVPIELLCTSGARLSRIMSSNRPEPGHDSSVPTCSGAMSEGKGQQLGGAPLGYPLQECNFEK